jgi:hypothetical protein
VVFAKFGQKLGFFMAHHDLLSSPRCLSFLIYFDSIKLSLFPSVEIDLHTRLWPNNPIILS